MVCVVARHGFVLRYAIRTLQCFSADFRKSEETKICPNLRLKFTDYVFVVTTF